MNIPEEAIEKAARVIHDQWAGDAWDGHTDSIRDDWRNTARAALAAVAPLLMAPAWEEGKRASDRDWTLLFDIHTPDEDRAPMENPYRAKEQP